MSASVFHPDLERRGWAVTCWAAGTFLVVLSAAMLVGHAMVRAQDPWRSPRLAELKLKLKENPRDEATKQAIRELDLKLRQRYFLQMSRMSSGVYLLLSGAVVFVIAATRSRRSTRDLPDLGRKPDPEARLGIATRARWSVAGVGFAVGALFAGLGITVGNALPDTTTELARLAGGTTGTNANAAASAPDAASPEEYSRNWPRFLGPQGNGFSTAANAPSHWSATNGTGIAWKVASPTPGFNSPLVWGNRVFFSGGDVEKREVVCLDAETGSIVWRQSVTEVPGSPKEMPEIPESTGFAAPTMATDGRRVYVIFANGDVAAFTLEGKKVWARHFGPFSNAYGHANSLVTWKDRLFLQLDQGDAEEGKSKLVALDGRTGQTTWQKTRKVGASWASPNIFEAAGKVQVALLSLPWASAYSAVDGAELWKADCLNGEVTPTPIFAGGLLLVASPSEKLIGIRPDGQGDVTKTHVAWAYEEAIPDVTSPVSNGELVFMITTSGLFTCVDVKDGKRVWEHDYEMEFHASPVIAAGRVFLVSQDGLAFIVEAGREYKELLRSHLPDSFHATPAVVDGRIFLRGMTNVWGLK